MLGSSQYGWKRRDGSHLALGNKINNASPWHFLGSATQAGRHVVHQQFLCIPTEEMETLLKSFHQGCRLGRECDIPKELLHSEFVEEPRDIKFPFKTKMINQKLKRNFEQGNSFFINAQNVQL